MRNKLLVSTALLAAAVAAASCEKTPAPKPQFRPYLELAGTRLFSPRVRGKFLHDPRQALHDIERVSLCVTNYWPA